MITLSFQLYIWQLKDNDLMGVAFIDTHIYIHTLVTIKHIILAGDILKSVSFYQYQEEHKVLSIVSRVSTSSGKGRPGLKATKPNMDLKINNF
jgi:hypothetical protein